MLDRKFWDRVAPDDPPMWSRASRIVGLGTVPYGLVIYHDVMENAARYGVFLGEALRWLASANEPWFAPKIDWYEALKPCERPYGMPWNIHIWGLDYKDEAHYLTAQGWPLGTECWYVRVECGNHEYACAETPELAAARGVILVDAFRRWRATPPGERKYLEAYVDQANGVELTPG